MCISKRLLQTFKYTAAVKQSHKFFNRPSKSGAGGANPMNLQKSALNHGRAYWYMGSICAEFDGDAYTSPQRKRMPKRTCSVYIGITVQMQVEGR